MEVFEITVNYKSGLRETFKATEFKVANGKFDWIVADAKGHRPLVMGVDNIESVWYRNVELPESKA